MSLEVGIVGLPNSGKSTLFNALMKRQIADVAEYPFTTIEPNVGVVEVPDERLQKLAEIIQVERIRGLETRELENKKTNSLIRQSTNSLKIVPAAIKFIDIAGLVKDAHKGAGLGNRFLAKIRECDAILHVVREFENPQVVHVMGNINSERDIAIINEELKAADISKPTFVYLNKEYPDDSALDLIISMCYKLLQLITMFTVEGGRLVQAWPVKQDLTIWQAAGMIHSDFQEKFIKAEVINYENLVEVGSFAQAKARGLLRIEGKDYILADGDIITVKI